MSRDISVPAEDTIPTIDDRARLTPEAVPSATYRDWTPDQTRVVTYTTNPAAFPHDVPVVSFDEARTMCQARYGRILEENSAPAAMPERLFLRVKRQVAVPTAKVWGCYDDPTRSAA